MYIQKVGDIGSKVCIQKVGDRVQGITEGRGYRVQGMYLQKVGDIGSKVCIYRR